MEPAAREAQQQLLVRRRALVRLHGACLSQEKELRETPTPDWVDQASDGETVDLLVELGERERAELGEIDAALARIEAGTFGICEGCGDPIGRDRLRALPEARLCRGCSA
jgi:RNA polymerase-binding protein DksA